MTLKVALVLGALAVTLAPAMALANQPAKPGHGHGHANRSEYAPAPPTPGPKAPYAKKAKAYGVYCRGQSKKHVAGQKGTPFSQCVTAMAKAANNHELSPAQACKGMSRKHLKGEKGTPFSRCVKGAAKVQSK
jgi:hypothetical protein